jgi:hypothetical protein
VDLTSFWGFVCAAAIWTVVNNPAIVNAQAKENMLGELCHLVRIGSPPGLFVKALTIKLA